MDLTVGPNAFFWTPDNLRAFYAGLAETPVARVVIGEWVCSKRLPFWQDEIPGAVAALQAAGKEVAVTSLALITLKRERKQTDDLVAMGLPVEVNDLSALRHIPEGTPFWVGPMVNVYNEGTLMWLARRGATRVCLPPELPLSAIAALAKAGSEAGVAVEVWAHGRAPLAISGRCYHARLTDRAKDSCQFVCADDPDGRDVDTLDGRAFLSVNGVQTLARAVTTAAHQIAALREAGVAALRLSPHTGNFAAVAAAYAESLGSSAGQGEALVAELKRLMPGAEFCDGFLRGEVGRSLSGASAA
ncbi:U32 family peptidase [Rhodobacter sp. Har01]|uniref:ubiquinone anaerobic biosynthesis protein UbiV n=1 Tax=Rhodobacter sp. Har01 TaxID=2883999 RepID=UPI001D070159|nr:U32 family peptidase [Rhodobacter sp. Har01]MCB6176711.1 U32 family peptidase [Rhodobacter sp. Har01]